MTNSPPLDTKIYQHMHVFTKKYSLGVSVIMSSWQLMATREEFYSERRK